MKESLSCTQSAAQIHIDSSCETQARQCASAYRAYLHLSNFFIVIFTTHTVFMVLVLLLNFTPSNIILVYQVHLPSYQITEIRHLSWLVVHLIYVNFCH